MKDVKLKAGEKLASTESATAELSVEHQILVAKARMLDLIELGSRLQREFNLVSQEIEHQRKQLKELYDTKNPKQEE